MISVKELIEQFHSDKKNHDSDMLNIESLVVITARENVRECTYDILTVNYSTAMNHLKELGYKVTVKQNFNKQITTLLISW